MERADQMIGNIMERRWGRPADPTPMEIAAATARIRMHWSEAEHRLRAGIVDSCDWELPIRRVARNLLVALAGE